VAEVDLNIVCKHCGSEVSPYITECPYCGQRLRKRAPKLKPDVTEGAEAKPRRRRLRRKGPRVERLLAWLAVERPVATITLVIAVAALYVIEWSIDFGIFDFGAIINPLDGDWWRIVAANFIYENIGYLLAVGVAVAIFGSSLERRYGPLVPLLGFVGAGAAGMALAVGVEDFPVALGGNGAGLGLLCMWLVRDLRDRQVGTDTDSDLLGVAAIAAVLALMPLLETTADGWAGLGGAAAGAVLGVALPARR